MSEKKHKVPKLRFPGFTGDWERRKLGDVIDRFEYGLNAAATEYDGVHKYIRITDIDDVSHKFLKSNLTTPKIDFQDTDTEMYKLKEGDILFARTGASVGKTYLYDINDGDLYFAGFLIRGHVNRSNNAKFVYQNTLTENYDLFIKITSQRSGQPGVNSKEYAEFKLYIPSKEEQEKISSVLTDFDNLIILHQRKLETLKLKKKALLQKLFPKNGEQFPELRFPGFTDAWEQRKLGEIGKNISGTGFPEVEQKGTQGIPFFKVSDMNHAENNFEMLVSNNYVNEEQILRNNWTVNEKPAVIFAKVGAAIALNRKRLVRGKFLIDNNMMAFLPNIESSVVFIKYLFDCINLPKYAQSGALPSYNASGINKIIINVPNDQNEQMLISNFLNKIDNLITLHQRKSQIIQNVHS